MAISRERFKGLTGMDLDGVLSGLHLPETAYERVLKVLLTTIDTRMVEFAAALGGGDRLSVQKIAHDLKGVLANLRLDPLSRMAAEIEQSAKGTGEMTEAWPRYESLAAGVERLKELVA